MSKLLSTLSDLSGHVVVFGGSFDPIQKAHVAIARAVLTQKNEKVDSILFIPARQNPHKTKLPQASNAQRVAMLELALGIENNMFHCTLELDRAGKSYTYDTIMQLRSEARPKTKFSLLIGSDNIASFPKWYKCTDLVKSLEHLYIYERPGFPLDAISKIESELGKEISAAFKRDAIAGASYNESSSDIRERIAKGEDCSAMLDGQVYTYIERQGLYR